MSNRLKVWVRPRLAVVLAGIAGLATVVIVVGAQEPDNEINACVERHSGRVRIVTNGSCHRNEVLLVWNVAGPQGPEGPRGPSDAFSIEASSPIEIPSSFSSILSLDVPAGKYVVYANVGVHNLSDTRALPVSCALGGPTENGVPYSVRLDPFRSATLLGASSATIPVALTTELYADGTPDLQCITNVVSGWPLALVESRQITAIRVGELTELDLAP
jgi:hypothetical protein